MSANQRYWFDPRTFTYHKVRKGLGYYLGKGLPYVLLTLASAVGFVALFYYLYDSPRSEQLKREQAMMVAAITHYSNQADTLRSTIKALQERDKALYRRILASEPPKDKDSAAAAAANDSIPPVITESADLEAISSRVDALNSRLQAATEGQQRMVEIARANRGELAHIPSIRPVPSTIISGFGTRRNPIFKKDMFHAGIDFSAEMGTPVRATADGVVRVAGSGGNGIGTMVEIDHGNGYVTRYGHLSKVSVRAGKRVKRNDVIALSGSSGISKGPHLYYEVRKQGKPVDPIDYFFNDLKPEELAVFKQAASKYNESMN